MIKRLCVTAVTAALALGAACAQTQSPVADAGAPPTCATIEIAEVIAADAPGARQVPTIDGAAISVSSDPLVSTPDIAAVRPAIAEGHQVLEIDLSAAPAASLRAFTAAHVGARLAFIVNGSVRNVARILDPIQGQGLILDPVTASEAEALVQCLRAPQSPGPAADSASVLESNAALR